VNQPDWSLLERFRYHFSCSEGHCSREERKLEPGDPRLRSHYMRWCCRCRRLVSIGIVVPIDERNQK
jgi:hypothetical protein